jgi:hypothetical protein
MTTMYTRRKLFLLVVGALALLSLHRLLSTAPAAPYAPPEIPANVEATLDSAYAYYGFQRGISIFQPDNLTKHLVIPCTSTEDTSWVSTLPGWLNITPKIYHVPPHGALVPPGALSVAINKGNEAMAYLTYIIDHYDALPDLVVFTHASYNQWHNNELHMFATPLMLREFNYRRAKRLGYANLRCGWKPGCPAWIKPHTNEYNNDKGEEFYFKRAFEKLFPGTEVPEVVAAACCAQFVVTKEKVRGNTREEYVRWREWLVETEIVDRYSGRIMEYLWHYIFSPRENRETVNCPAEHVCYCDGYGICFGGEKELEEHLALGKETADMETRLQNDLKEGPKPGDDLWFRDAALQQLRDQIEDRRNQLIRQIEAARERGRDRRVRISELGEAEFTE